MGYLPSKSKIAESLDESSVAGDWAEQKMDLQKDRAGVGKSFKPEMDLWPIMVSEGFRPDDPSRKAKLLLWKDLWRSADVEFSDAQYGELAEPGKPKPGPWKTQKCRSRKT